MTVFKQLLNDYKHCLIRGDHSDGAAAYLALVDEYEQAARRAPAAPVPQGWKLVPVELLERIQESLGSFVSDQGWSQSDMDTADALDGLLYAAPQPPGAAQSNSAEFDGIEKAAAPVELPEPSAWMLGCQTMGGDVGWKLSWSKSGAGVCHRLSGEEFEHPLYTEQQVRELLAAHGIGKEKA